MENIENIYHLEPMYGAVSEVLTDWSDKGYPIKDKDPMEIAWDIVINDKEYEFETKVITLGWTLEGITNCVILFKSWLTSQ